MTLLTERLTCWCGAPADGISWRWSAIGTRDEHPECLRCKQQVEAADRRFGVSTHDDLGWRWSWL